MLWRKGSLMVVILAVAAVASALLLWMAVRALASFYRKSLVRSIKRRQEKRGREPGVVDTLMTLDHDTSLCAAEVTARARARPPPHAVARTLVKAMARESHLMLSTFGEFMSHEVGEVTKRRLFWIATTRAGVDDYNFYQGMQAHPKARLVYRLSFSSNPSDRRARLTTLSQWLPDNNDNDGDYKQLHPPLCHRRYADMLADEPSDLHRWQGLVLYLATVPGFHYRDAIKIAH
ncbi:hypothetical protein [Mollivirus kamchatka]|nr:hypothetical protein [Mollivirus kamchatka]